MNVFSFQITVSNAISCSKSFTVSIHLGLVYLSELLQGLLLDSLAVVDRNPSGLDYSQVILLEDAEVLRKLELSNHSRLRKSIYQVIVW